MTSPETLSALWYATLEAVVDRAAHEVKDALNGVSLNLEVIRSRSGREGVAGKDIAPFATAAADQLEGLTARTESLLFLSRALRAGAGEDVAVTLRYLATLLVPAARADGRDLRVTGPERGVGTSASWMAVRLALASALLSTFKAPGRAECHLESGADAVVRFSHESAGTCSLPPAVADALAVHKISSQRSEHDLVIVFPGP